MTETHEHRIATEDGDECVCGEILCPDTGTVVDYDGGSRYWHRDGTTCFLHRTVGPL